MSSAILQTDAEKEKRRQLEIVRNLIKDQCKVSKNPIGKLIWGWVQDRDVETVVTNGDDNEPLNIDKVEGAFPIYKTDTLEKVFNKYLKVFAVEVKEFLDQWHAYQSVLHNEKGMSKSKNLRIAAKIPANMKSVLDVCHFLGKCPQYTESKEAMKILKRLAPKLFIGNL